MSRIYKVEAYILDINDDYTNCGEIVAILGQIDSHTIIIESDFKDFEWDDDLPINNINADIAEYEEYFKENINES